MPTRLFSYTSDLPFAALRINPVDVGRYEVAGYDIDNGYPQRMQSLIKASPTAKMSTNLFADFIFGQGFAVGEGKSKYGADREDGVWNMVFNTKGQTGDDLLTLAAKDWSEFKKFWVHVNYNALFTGVEIQIIPFEQVRYGIRDKSGKVAVYNKWWTQSRFGNLRSNTDKPDYIDLFNPDPGAIKKQVSEAGGWKSYKGQMIPFSRTFEQYPECTLDAVIEAMEAEIMSFRTSKNNLKNNFGDKIIWIEKGEFETTQQLDDFKDDARNWIGPDGEQLIVASVRATEEAPEIKAIENKLTDTKFKYTNENCRAAIYRQLGQNAILHSDLTEGRYNQNQLPEAIKAYNNRTERDRIDMQRSFSTLFALMGIQSDAAITPLNEESYAINNSQGASNGTDTTNIQS